MIQKSTWVRALGPARGIRQRKGRSDLYKPYTSLAPMPYSTATSLCKTYSNIDTADPVTNAAPIPPNHDSAHLCAEVAHRLSLFLLFYNHTKSYIQHRKGSNQISAILFVQKHPDLALRDRSSRHDLSPTRTLHDHQFPHSRHPGSRRRKCGN
jgi:hypothetical protein